MRPLRFGRVPTAPTVVPGLGSFTPASVGVRRGVHRVAIPTQDSSTLKYPPRSAFNTNRLPIHLRHVCHSLLSTDKHVPTHTRHFTSTPSTPPTSHNPIPIIDISPFLSPTGPTHAKTAVVNHLVDAITTYGVFYITHHGITPEKMERIFEAARVFFALPESVKRKIPIKSGGFTRGYVGIGEESGSEAFEVKEAFSYGYPWDPKVPPTNPLQGANEWPDRGLVPEGWRETVEEFYADMIKVSEALTRILSLALGKDESYLPQFCEGGDTISLMRMFHYFPYSKANELTPPPSASTSAPGSEFDRIGSSPHTDWGFLTLIAQQDGITGLQLGKPKTTQKGSSEEEEIEWIDVPPVPGTLIVNGGDYLSLMSGGRFVSPLHRVVSPVAPPPKTGSATASSTSTAGELDGNGERYSMVLFYYPNYDAKIPTVSNIQGQGQDADEAQGSVGRNQAAYSLFKDQRVVKKGLGQESGKGSGLKTEEGVAQIQSFGQYISEKWSQVYRG
ncbi:hypothetical protein HK102_005935 [Quaeritorhiza haematococci]|nr:hypothetical protein HK102_005935 [Quaeritorhiza haematococci]